jgi:hypothetical protein
MGALFVYQPTVTHTGNQRGRKTMKFMNRHSKYLSPNSQPGSGATGSNAPTDNASGAGGSDAPTAENADDKGSQPTFTQADLDRILTDRLGRQEKKLRREFEEQAEKQVEAELADTAEWQTLAEKRQTQIAKLEAKIGDLEQQAETAVKYGKALETYVAKLADGLPAPILALMEGMDQAAKLEWLTANRAQFAQADTSEQPKQPDANGVPPTPPASGQENISEDQRRKVAYQARL